jgi:phage gpG-like protein
MNATQFADACHDAAVMPPSVIVDALEECKGVIRAGIAENFANQSDAGGGAWPPRRDPGDGHPLLNQNGTLMAAATGDGVGSVGRIVDGKELQVGVAVGESGSLAGAAVHQFGATIRPRVKKMLSWINGSGQRVFAKQVTIPARPYIGVNDATVDECCEIVADHVVGAMFQ